MEQPKRNGYVVTVTSDGRSWGIYKNEAWRVDGTPAWWGGGLTDDNQPEDPGSYFWNATIATSEAIGLAQTRERMLHNRRRPAP